MNIKVVLGLLAGAMLPASLHATGRFWEYYDPRPSNYIGSEEWWHGDAFSGDWWGLRNWLDEDVGIEFSLSYAINLAGNPVGGLRQGCTYTDNIGFGVALDMEKLIGWQGATITVSGLDRNGTSLSQDYIGNQFTVQQVYGGQTAMLYGLYLEQAFWDKKASLKIGRYATGDDFASSPVYWLYMNNGIDGNPQALPVNAQFSAYPWAVWAARLRVDPSPEWNAQFGVYQVSNRTFDRNLHGVNMNMQANDGVMLITQLGWTPEFFKRPVPKAASDGKSVQPQPSNGRVTFGNEKNPAPPADDMRGLPGHYWFGAYYSSWEYPQFGQDSTAANAYGFYWHGDQMIYQEAPGSSQGLTAWTAFVLSPQQNVSKVPFQWNSGLFYRGFLPTRDKDTALFGLAYGNFSGDYGQADLAYDGEPASFEMALEWGYRVQLNDFFYIQPDVQYIVRPGGTGSIPNAFVLGAQIGVSF
ncbi:MAG: carbohydrate porin [Chthoniobacterales bacterium]|nr:carbohydrate porin [Chthoniobacterales bacterium]